MNNRSKKRSILDQLKHQASSPRRLRGGKTSAQNSNKFKKNRSLSKKVRHFGSNRRSSTDLKQFRGRIDSAQVHNFTLTGINQEEEESSDHTSYTESQDSSDSSNIKVRKNTNFTEF